MGTFFFKKAAIILWVRIPSGSKNLEEQFCQEYNESHLPPPTPHPSRHTGPSFLHVKCIFKKSLQSCAPVTLPAHLPLQLWKKTAWAEMHPHMSQGTHPMRGGATSRPLSPSFADLWWEVTAGRERTSPFSLLNLFLVKLNWHAMWSFITGALSAGVNGDF